MTWCSADGSASTIADDDGSVGAGRTSSVRNPSTSEKNGGFMDTIFSFFWDDELTYSKISKQRYQEASLESASLDDSSSDEESDDSSKNIVSCPRRRPLDEKIIQSTHEEKEFLEFQRWKRKNEPKGKVKGDGLDIKSHESKMSSSRKQKDSKSNVSLTRTEGSSEKSAKQHASIEVGSDDNNVHKRLPKARIDKDVPAHCAFLPERAPRTPPTMRLRNIFRPQLIDRIPMKKSEPLNKRIFNRRNRRRRKDTNSSVVSVETKFLKKNSSRTNRASRQKRNHFHQIVEEERDEKNCKLEIKRELSQDVGETRCQHPEDRQAHAEKRFRRQTNPLSSTKLLPQEDKNGSPFLENSFSDRKELFHSNKEEPEWMQEDLPITSIRDDSLQKDKYVHLEESSPETVNIASFLLDVASKLSDVGRDEEPLHAALRSTSLPNDKYTLIEKSPSEALNLSSFLPSVLSKLSDWSQEEKPSTKRDPPQPTADDAQREMPPREAINTSSFLPGVSAKTSNWSQEETPLETIKSDPPQVIGGDAHREMSMWPLVSIKRDPPQVITADPQEETSPFEVNDTSSVFLDPSSVDQDFALRHVHDEQSNFGHGEKSSVEEQDEEIMTEQEKAEYTTLKNSLLRAESRVVEKEHFFTPKGTRTKKKNFASHHESPTDNEKMANLLKELSLRFSEATRGERNKGIQIQREKTQNTASHTIRDKSQFSDAMKCLTEKMGAQIMRRKGFSLGRAKDSSKSTCSNNGTALESKKSSKGSDPPATANTATSTFSEMILSNRSKSIDGVKGRSTQIKSTSAIKQHSNISDIDECHKPLKQNSQNLLRGRAEELECYVNPFLCSSGEGSHHSDEKKALSKMQRLDRVTDKEIVADRPSLSPYHPNANMTFLSEGVSANLHPRHNSVVSTRSHKLRRATPIFRETNHYRRNNLNSVF